MEDNRFFKNQRRTKIKINMEDELTKKKMEDKLKKKMENNLNNNFKKSTLIGCDIIVN